MSVGPLVRIAYHVPGMNRRRQVVVAGDGACAGGNDARELGVTVRGNEFVRRVSVSPVVPVVLDEAQATFHVDVDAADAIYLNGYSCWTDSVERPVRGRMWDLTRAPQQMIDASQADAYGDYRFVEPDTRPGHQHGFGYCYLRQGDQVLLLGSLSEDAGFTLIREDADEGTITFEKEPPARIVEAGEDLEVLSLALTTGTLEEAFEAYLALAHVRPRPALPLIGYTSWYRRFAEIDRDVLLHDLEGVSSVLGRVNTEGLMRVFQIDDGWCKVGDWTNPNEERFAGGMAELAGAIHERGLKAGLWLAPFACERNSRLFAEHPEWLLRDESGALVRAGSNWSGASALDTRAPAVRDYVRGVLRMVTQEWGFDVLKLDFLYMACLEVHDGLNRGQLMADALDLVREVVPDTALLFCGVPMVSAFGRCEYCRIGPDVGLDWDGAAWMHLLHRERVSTKRSIANARGRRHLNGRVFLSDPDVLHLRDEGVSLSASERVQLFAADTTCGGVLFTSDDMGTYDEARLQKYREAVERFRAACGLD